MARGVTADQFTGCSQRFISMDRNLEGRDWETAGKAIWRRDMWKWAKNRKISVSQVNAHQWVTQQSRILVI